MTKMEPPRLEGGSRASEVNHDAPAHPTVVGIPEIAALLNVKRQTVDMWRYRGIFPPPRWTIGGGPAWDRADVLAWAEAR